LGGTSSGANRLVGQLQELRLWSSSLNDEAFNNHVKAPAAYNGNIDSYTELVFRLPLTQNINHNLTGSLTGVEPKPSNISASFSGWSLATPYDSIEETYYYDAISLGAGTFDDNKIRIEENELVGALDVKTRAERSQFDRAPLDSKKLGVYFSPQTMIDEDIIAQLGFTALDEYIGDPGEKSETEYPDLIRIAQGYWKKYETRNDINAYIRMFTLFDLSFFKQLEQVLPARVNKMTGVLIQPNILERNKQTILPVISRENVAYTTIIDQTKISAVGDYLQFTGSIDGKILEIVAEDDDQWQIYLTASTADKYDGVAYSHEYLVLSGSEYITASSPYWLSEATCPAITSSVVSEFSERFLKYSITEVDVATTGRLGSVIYNFSDTLTYVTTIPVPGGVTYNIDGVVIGMNDTVLIKNGTRQTNGLPATGSSNGVYNVSFVDEYTLVLSRIGNIDASSIVYVKQGNTNKNNFFKQTISNPNTTTLLPTTDPTVPTYVEILTLDTLKLDKRFYTYEPAEVTDFFPRGIENQRYSGTKMTSPAFNVNSTQTYDGGPVAEWRTANPNQLIYQTIGDQGSFRLA
jgi:hypothetical protein